MFTSTHTSGSAEHLIEPISEFDQIDISSSSSPADTSSESEDDSSTASNPIKVVLVTGGAGFIGSHVSEYLLNRGDRVVIIDELNDYYDVRIKRNNLTMLKETFGDRVSIYEGDICNSELMTRIYEVEQPNYVCHLAARAGVRPSIQDPYVYIHSNIEGTTRLMDLARTYGCENFVFASSSSVYGGSMKEVFTEEDVVDFPVSPYAASKKACELMAFTYHHLYGMNVAGLRFFTVYGPRGRPDMAPFKFIDRVSRGVAIQQFGDGSSCRDYTYIDDIVDGVVRALDRPLGYQIYNLGNGEPVMLSKFINLVEQNVGKLAKIQIMPEQPGDVPRTCADISKARRLLGYDPKTPFADGIHKTVEWYNQAIADRDIDHNPEYGTYGGLCRSNSNVQLEKPAHKKQQSLVQLILQRNSESCLDPERVL